MLERKNYLNLTNGLLAVEKYELTEWSYVRIQSTQCEQHLWSDVILGLSDDLLMNLALGNICYVYDAGVRKDKSRAIWQGLPFIEFALFTRWFDIEPHSFLNGERAYKGGPDFFRRECNNLSKRAKKKIDYFKKYTSSRPRLYLWGISFSIDKEIR